MSATRPSPAEQRVLEAMRTIAARHRDSAGISSTEIDWALYPDGAPRLNVIRVLLARLQRKGYVKGRRGQWHLVGDP